MQYDGEKVMAHSLATWKTLEDLLVELKKEGVAIPTNVIEDLRAARSMIRLSSMEAEDCQSEPVRKADEYLTNVEVYLMTEADKVLGSDKANEWLERIEQSRLQTCEVPKEEDKFITGVPRDQKWVRVEPTANMPAERIQQVAMENNLSVNPQVNGRLVVFGQPEQIRQFLRGIVEKEVKGNS